MKNKNLVHKTKLYFLISFSSFLPNEATEYKVLQLLH